MLMAVKQQTNKQFYAEHVDKNNVVYLFQQMPIATVFQATAWPASVVVVDFTRSLRRHHNAIGPPRVSIQHPMASSLTKIGSQLNDGTTARQTVQVSTTGARETASGRTPTRHHCPSRTIVSWRHHVRVMAYLWNPMSSGILPSPLQPLPILSP
jgi:hypothetical protein